MRVTAHLPECGEVDEVEMPLHEFCERRLGTVVDVAAEELGVCVHGGTHYHRANRKPNKVLQGCAPSMT
jgi:hypothetical protein